MKSSILILTITLILLQAIEAASASDVTLTPGGAAGRTVAPNEFVTLSYTATGNFRNEKQFTVSVNADPALKLIGAAAPVSLRAGAPAKFALTFQVSGKAADSQAMPVSVMLSPAPGGAEAARAEMLLTAESSVCAEFQNLPSDVSAEGKRTSEVVFSIYNCGGGATEFLVEVSPGNDIDVTSNPKPVMISSRESKQISFSIYPLKDTAAYKSTLKLRVLHKGAAAAEKRLQVKVERPALSNRTSRYLYIPLKLSIKYAFGNDHGAKASLNLSVPAFRDNNLAFRMNAQLQDGGAAPNANRQTYDLGYGHSRLIYGGQRVVFSDLLAGSEYDEGLLVARSVGSGAFSFFNGGSALGRGSFFKLSQPMSKRILMDAVFFNSNNTRLNGGGVSGANLKMKYASGKYLSLNGEIAKSKGATAEYPDGASGDAFQLGADFKKGNAKISASARGGSAGFATKDFIKGFNVESQFRTSRDALYFISCRRRSSYTNALDSQGVVALVPYTSFSRSIGHTRNISRRFSASVSANSFRTLKSGADYLSAGGGNQDTMLLSLTRRGSSFSLTASMESGTKQNFSGAGQLREFKLDSDFKLGKTKLSAGFASGNKTSVAGISARKGNSYSFAASQEISGLNTQFSLGFARSSAFLASGQYGAATDFTFVSDSRISKNAGLRIAYGISTRGGYRTNIFRADYSRLLDMSIRYKKLGAITGRVFEDINRNGTYDAGDKPLKNVRLKKDGENAVFTDETGGFEIPGLKPGTYTLKLDSGTYPIGMALPGGNGGLEVNIKAGRVEMDFPLQKVMRISGRVHADRTDYFAKYSNLDAGKLRIVLKKGDSTAGEAFTDKEGYYYFENVIPGFYDVLLDPEWIAKDSEIRGTGKYSMNCSGPDVCRDLDFTIAAKTKEIKKTFSK